MLQTRQQLKAKKRNAKRLGQLLKQARIELEQSIATLEDTAIDQGSWEMTDISSSQNFHSVIGQILAIADEWHQLNHFQIEEKLSQIEHRFYAN
ncbi:MAG TPA: hypothetical protein DD379_05440 [Cyanobacteria bacterium UBA11162]|nr:hypothetical protein [Cyanobacteria bacterium UBA12227]HAX88163.1 hypothetical protein [Cyanobacteria bacterium UBA11370]HBL10840.1 hypothetical protein [Cyanobacteria bacterium UBA11162]HBY77486.1 hypothetical protein [Cyanobacteria bacterium UBA11148]